MNEPNKKEIEKIIKNHEKWVKTEGKEGKQGNFSDMELAIVKGNIFHGRILKNAMFINTYIHGIDMSNCDLDGADFSGARVYDVDMSNSEFNGAKFVKSHLTNVKMRNCVLNKSNMSRSVMSQVDFMGSELENVNMNMATIEHVVFSNCDFLCADFRRSSLRDVAMKCGSYRNADFSMANLVRVDMCNSDFYEAKFVNGGIYSSVLTEGNFDEVDFRGVKVNTSTIGYVMACPSEGSYIGWKKCGDKCGEYIVKLLVTEDALRSSATTRKCRCSKAKVLEIQTMDGHKSNKRVVYSTYHTMFKYEVGKVVSVSDFDPNRWIECSIGIHHFVSREDAVFYGM